MNSKDSFEVPVQLEHQKFIAAYFPDSKVIIEQKNSNVDLEKLVNQSDGSKLTPYQQAERYITGLPVSMHPEKIITCNFREFLIYDMETLEPPIKIRLEELPDKLHLLDFLIDPTKNSDPYLDRILFELAPPRKRFAKKNLPFDCKEQI